MTEIPHSQQPCRIALAPARLILLDEPLMMIVFKRIRAADARMGSFSSPCCCEGWLFAEGRRPRRLSTYREKEDAASTRHSRA